MRLQQPKPKWKVFLPLAVGTALFCWVGACGGGSSPTDPAGGSSGPGGPGTGTVTSSTGSLVISMTDEPTDEICELVVYIQDLRVKPDGQPQKLLGSEIGDFELLALQDGPPARLGDFTVTQGGYQFIEILLDESRSYVIEKEDPSDPANPSCLEMPSALQVPSAKVKVAGGPFNVDANTAITIDFDAGQSLKKKGGNSSKDKGWQLKPVVSIVSVDS